MALEKSATSRSTPTATRSTPSPSSAKSESAPRSGSLGSSKGPSASPAPETDRDDAPKSAVLEPEDSVTLSSGPKDDFDPDAMGKLSRSLRAEQSTSGEEAVDEAESAPETDSILDPTSEDYAEQIASHAAERTELAKQRLEAGEYSSEAMKQSDLLEAERSVEDYIDAREYINSVAPRDLDSYVPEDFVGTEKERVQAALRARREEGIELMDEVMADPDLTIEERNAALGSVRRHFEYNAVRARQRDPVTLETVHQDAFPEEIYGSDAQIDPRTNAIINHDPNKGMSPYSITFDPINKALNPESHISSFLRNPSRLADVAWSGQGAKDLVGRAWQSLTQ